MRHENAQCLLITKEVFQKAREVMKGDPQKTPIGTKEFGFTKMFKCGACKGGITADEKLNALKMGRLSDTCITDAIKNGSLDARSLTSAKRIY